MLTWSNHSTTGEHFAFLCDYKPRINAKYEHQVYYVMEFLAILQNVVALLVYA